MLFFGKKTKDDKVNKSVPKKPSTVRTALDVAFNPHFGRSLQPLEEVTGTFVQLLASIFIAQKMFPANHPAYLGINGQRLTLGLLLFTVWKNLKFTRENVPQVLLFFALIFGIVFAGIACVLFVLSLLGTVFIGKAHAQGYYTYSGGDVAQEWLGFLFGGAATSHFDIFNSNGPLYFAEGLQGTFIRALGFYSDAILVVAAVVMFYHLASMTVETAHEGVVLGKQANQIWAPIRLVVAIGLLVPIGGGLNSGQYIVITMAQWGSALASNVWCIIVGGIAGGTGVALSPPPDAEPVYNALLSGACKGGYNNYDKEMKDAGGGNPMGGPSYSGGRAGSGTCTENSTPNIHNAGICGCRSQTPCDDVLMNAEQYGEQKAKMFTEPGIPGGDSGNPPSQNDGQYGQFVSDYLSCLATGMPVPSTGMGCGWGWAGAGAVVSAASQAEANANDTSGAVSTTTGPDFAGGGDEIMSKKVKGIVNSMQKYIDMPASGGGGGGGLGSGACGGQGQALQDIVGFVFLGKMTNHFLDRILMLIDAIARWECIWDDSGIDMIHFGGANPISEMAALGHRMINGAYDTYDVMVNLNAQAGTAIEKAGRTADFVGSRAGGIGSLLKMNPDAAKAALQAISTLLSMITTMFFTGGVMLAYYMPLIPFMRFLFSVLAWVVAVLEGVIGVPMIALAHLTTTGYGLPGQAKNAYFFVFHIMLKPVLMVFGLAVGLMTFYIAVDYMNMFYEMAISSDAGLASGHLLLSRLIYSAIYVIILYGCANNCFKTIEFIPTHAMRWLGVQGLTFAQMGDPAQVGGVLQQGANQFMGAATQAGSSWGGALALQGGHGGSGGPHGGGGPNGGARMPPGSHDSGAPLPAPIPGGPTGGPTGGSTGGPTGGSTGGPTGGSTGGPTGGSTGGPTGGSTGGALPENFYTWGP